MAILRRYLTEMEQQQLLRKAKSSNDPLAQRDFQWIRLLILTGARINEFAQWTAGMAELALRNGYIVVPAHMRKGFSAKREKGEEPKDPKRVPHSYFVTPTIRECLEALLRLSAAENAPLDGGPSPLVWGDGQALSVRSYQVRLKLWAREAGLPGGVSPHWLRHTRAMNMIRRSRSANPLKVAQLALGHASLSSTGIYTQMSREEFERDLLAIDGKRLSRKAAVAAAQGSQGVLL